MQNLMVFICGPLLTSSPVMPFPLLRSLNICLTFLFHRWNSAVAKSSSHAKTSSYALHVGMNDYARIILTLVVFNLRKVGGTETRPQSGGQTNGSMSHNVCSIYMYNINTGGSFSASQFRLMVASELQSIRCVAHGPLSNFLFFFYY